MTNLPEVVLAREAGLCYATLPIVTNFAAGIATGPLSHEEVVAITDENSERLKKLLKRGLEIIPRGAKLRLSGDGTAGRKNF